jgi:hypothetical protein
MMIQPTFFTGLLATLNGIAGCLHYSLGRGTGVNLIKLFIFIIDALEK